MTIADSYIKVVFGIEKKDSRKINLRHTFYKKRQLGENAEAIKNVTRIYKRYT